MSNEKALPSRESKNGRNCGNKTDADCESHDHPVTLFLLLAIPYLAA
jgi:hypothetical protein